MGVLTIDSEINASYELPTKNGTSKTASIRIDDELGK
jgi:hypothetical protein